MRRFLLTGFVVASVFCLLSPNGCRRKPPSNVDRNRAPETYITRAPGDNDVSYYRVHLYWSGSDPDGSIAYYEFAITDSNEVPGTGPSGGSGYTPTLRTDSLFVLRSEFPAEQNLLNYRFYVRAVDNEGRIDPTPALASFIASNDHFPEVIFTGGEGRWVDGCGQARLRRFNGRDTIGVESDSAFVRRLEVPGSGVHKLVADVQDASSYNPRGRRGRVIRYVRIIYVNPNAARRHFVRR